MPRARTLHRAAAWGDLPAIVRDLERGVPVNGLNLDGISALHLAAYRGHYEIMRALLAHSADVELGAPNNYTPLMVASRAGHLEAVEILLKHGAKVNAVSGYESALTFAGWYHPNFHVLELLLAHGADVAKFGGLALAGSAECGYEDNVSLLLSHGADMNYQTPLGKTALQLATEKNRTRVIKLLQTSASSQ